MIITLLNDEHLTPFKAFKKIYNSPYLHADLLIGIAVGIGYYMFSIFVSKHLVSSDTIKVFFFFYGNDVHVN